MGDPTREPRPFASPDHTGPGGTLDPRAPHRRGDRVAVHEPYKSTTSVPRRLRGRTIERLGTVARVHSDESVTVILEGCRHGPRTMRTVPAGEAHPRPGR